MEIQKTPAYMVAAECLEAISMVDLPAHSRDCPHCGLQIRYPTIAREQDLKDFERLISFAQTVLERHGYLGKVLSEIQAECYIQIAKKKK